MSLLQTSALDNEIISNQAWLLFKLSVLDSLRAALRCLNSELVTQRDHYIRASSDSSNISDDSNGNADCEDSAGTFPGPPQDQTSSNAPSQHQTKPTAQYAGHSENTSTFEDGVQRLRTKGV